MKNRGLAALLLLLLSVSEAKRFERCELAKVLKEGGLDRYRGVSLANWLCLTYYESGFNTKAVGSPNNYGARSYGLFQINGYWWCSPGRAKPTFGCMVYCKVFMDDDLRDDIECVKQIASEPIRMEAWDGWKKYCKGKNLSRWTKNCKL